MKVTAVALLCIHLAVWPASAATLEDPVQAAFEEISAESIQATMTFLADDLLEGREAGTQGYDLAAKWLAAQFQAVGLEPAGSEGYFQPIPFRGSVTTADESSLAILRDGKTQRLSYGKDFYFGTNSLNASADVNASAVFVGFGITALRLKHDDYAGVDVRGKVVVFIKGAPPSFPNDERAYHSSALNKARNAAAHGAIAVIGVRLPSEEKRVPWKRITERLDEVGMKWMHGETVGGTVPAIRIQATVPASVASILLAGSGQSADKVLAAAEKGKASSFPLKGTIRMHQVSKLQTLSSSNVIGLLRGSDSRLAQEYVIFSAHLDHEGMGAAVNGDRVFNGAFDNASGIAAMIEVARALQSMAPKPARSILFLAVTGEEKGLQGSEYYATYPTVPIERVVANVNLDMFVATFPIGDVIAFGAEHSTLGPVVDRAAKQVGWKLSADPMSEEVIFIRSDQYSFVRQGVPSVFIVSGEQSSDSSMDGKKLMRTWMREVYHTRKDDLVQPIHYPSLVTFSRMNLLIGLEIANNPTRPTWNPGDFFGDKLPF